MNMLVLAKRRSILWLCSLLWVAAVRSEPITFGIASVLVAGLAASIGGYFQLQCYVKECCGPPWVNDTIQGEWCIRVYRHYRVFVVLEVVHMFLGLELQKKTKKQKGKQSLV
jgi:hypothetical protein